MAKFWITMSATQVAHHWPTRDVPNGTGCVEIHAASRAEANEIAMKFFGPTWAFLYTELDNIHLLDRYVLLTITNPDQPAPEEWQKIARNLDAGSQVAERSHAKWCAGQYAIFTKRMAALHIEIPPRLTRDEAIAHHEAVHRIDEMKHAERHGL